MRFFLPILLFLFAFTPQPEPSSHSEILGQWIRVDDSYQGMKIEVLRKEGELIGRIISLPDQLLRFQIGDVKWKHIRMQKADVWQFSSLVISVDAFGNITGRRYDESLIEFISPDEIHTQTIRFRPTKSGNYQKWIREKPA